MDWSHHPSSTQLRHQQQLFGLLARSKQGAKVEKSPNSIWGISKEMSMICPPRTVFWYLAARVTSSLVALQGPHNGGSNRLWNGILTEEQICPVQVWDVSHVWVPASQKFRDFEAELRQFSSVNPQHILNDMERPNLHDSMPYTGGVDFGDPFISPFRLQSYPFMPQPGHLPFLEQPVSLAPSRHSPGTCHFQSVSPISWWPGHHEWCWRHITRSPKKQRARFYSMKCRSLAQKIWLQRPYPLQNGLMHLKHCLALGRSWVNRLKSELLNCCLLSFRFVSFRLVHSSTSLRGARNVPLFDDEARALVGTDFKRKGRYEVGRVEGKDGNQAWINTNKIGNMTLQKSEGMTRNETRNDMKRPSERNKYEETWNSVKWISSSFCERDSKEQVKREL